jgi:hypothetical protein
MRSKALLIAILVALPLPSLAEDDTAIELEAVRLEAIKKLTTELETLAEWCEKNKCYLGRDKCYELIILFNVDHEVARRTLKYYRRDGGEWKRRTYHEPSDRDAELTLEYQQKIAEYRAAFVSSLLGALEKAGDKVERDLMKILVADILRVDPDSEKARGLIGEVRHEGKWVLRETAISMERTAELKKTAEKLIEETDDPIVEDPDDVEKGLGLTWEGAFKGTWWRGLGTVPAEELKHAIKVMDASLPFFNEVFGLGAAAPRGCGVYLLTGKEDAEKALKNHPGFTDSQREYLLGLRAAWIPGRQVFFQWSDNQAVRLDGSVRMAIGILLMKYFQINTERGWFWEGGGLYLDYQLTGSHRTVFVTRDVITTTKRKPEFDIESRMKDPSANWVLLARRLVEAKAEPDLNVLTRKPVNSMTPEDLVYAYSLFKYIVEGFPEKATKFLMFSGEPIEQNVKANLGMPLHEFKERFHRWLEEST